MTTMTLIQGNLSDNLFCDECLTQIDDFTKYSIIDEELLTEYNLVLCENCQNITQPN